MTRARQDPKVSCPIVCGEYMRTTGFFYRSPTVTYLVTARHNVLPTNVHIEHQDLGTILNSYSTTDTLPTIDIYLRTEAGWETEQIDIRVTDTPCYSTDGVDLLAAKIEFDPREYGYHCWTEAEITSPTAEDIELSIIGFDGNAFPDTDKYDIKRYQRGIDLPSNIPVENAMLNNRFTGGIPFYGLAMDLDGKPTIPG